MAVLIGMIYLSLLQIDIWACFFEALGYYISYIYYLLRMYLRIRCIQEASSLRI